MKQRIFKAGDEGYMYIDVLVSLTIILIISAALYSGVISLKKTLAKSEAEFSSAVQKYETVIQKTDSE